MSSLPEGGNTLIAILVTTKDRPSALARSLPQIAALGAPVLVVDDGSSIADFAFYAFENVKKLCIPENRGLAAALNIGLSYWLADKSIDWISYFQDDVEVHPRTLEILSQFHGAYKVITGHDAAEHPAYCNLKVADNPEYDVKLKWSIRATHVHAHRDWWLKQMPFPTRELGAPKKLGPHERGLGSNVDWYFCRDGENSCQKTRTPILCVPGLVRTFLWKAEDSCWNNTQRAGEDAPLRAL